ncbi:MAG: thiamine ABC transporter substrate-binding protein [Desulfobacteraceae bacterium]|nr:thiamine ABC transporter substrate-binding protein [Desulfobacteraceae bacterium]
MKFIKLFILICLFTVPSMVFAGQNAQLVVMTHDSFSVSKKVLKKFEDENKVKVVILKAGDAGAALNQAMLSKNNPMADIFFGVDNAFLSRALKSGMFESYGSPKLAQIKDDLKLDSSNRLLPVTFGDVCLNYDKAWFKKHDLMPPSCLEDLLKPEYKGLLVVENPATSSPGLSFLLATIGHFGEDGYLAYWEKLKENDVFIVNGWQNAYWGQFSAASDGDRPIVVSYATSPPAEVYYSKKPLTKAPTGVVTGNESAFRQIEFAGILKGTKHRKLAEKFMDFILDISFQEDIPLQMFVFPANKNARLPDVFKKYAVIAKKTAIVPADLISQKRESWIEAWTEIVLR